MTPGLGGGLGGGSRNRQKQYFVIPKNRTREPYSDPGGWKVVKGYNETGANTVATFDSKQAAESRGKELVRKNNTTLTSFDSAKKGSRTFNYS